MTRTSRAAVVVAVVVVAACASVKDAVVDVDGAEVADVKEAHPDAIWLPLQQPLMQHSLDVVVLVDGQPVVATLDTGAMVTAMSSTLAQRLGLSERVAQSRDHMPITDAHGQAGQASRVLVSTLGFAQQWIDDASVWVFPSERETFLIGMDHLQRYDLYLVIDQGYVGLFPAGQGPRHDDDTVIPLIPGERSVLVRARAPGARGTAEATMVIDTGAEFTTFPSAPALEAGVPADLRFKATTLGVASEQRHEGMFRIDHLAVGDVDVGAVFAREATGNGGNGPGLLGLDVLARTRTLIVTSGKPELRLAPLPRRPAFVSASPGGFPCQGPCVAVGLVALPLELRAELVRQQVQDILAAAAADQLRGGRGDVASGRRTYALPRDQRSDGVCLDVDVDPAYADRVVEFAVTDVAGELGGNALTVRLRVPAGGLHDCIDLPASTAPLGLRAGTPLSLRFVRTGPEVVARCEADVCLWWSGP